MGKDPLTTAQVTDIVIDKLNEACSEHGHNRLPIEMTQQISQLNLLIEKEGHFSFETAKKIAKTRKDGSVQAKAGVKRQTLRTGRLFSRQLPGLRNYMSGKSIEHATCLINFNVWPDLTVSLVNGKAIEEAYRDGVGCSTCMSGEDRSKFIQMFVTNPDKISMLIISSHGQSGRAIVWKLDDGKTLMDRIYHSGSAIRDKLKQHAMKEGWLYRQSTSPGNTSIKRPAKKKGTRYIDLPSSEYKDLSVSGLNWIEGGVPYMDTLKFACIPDAKKDEMQIMHEHAKSPHKIYTLQGTGGQTAADRKCKKCSKRSHTVSVNHYNINQESIFMCSECAKKKIRICMCCDRHKWIDNNEYLATIKYCNVCFPKYYSLCTECKKPVYKSSDGNTLKRCQSCDAKRDQRIKDTVAKRQDKGEEISLFYVTTTSDSETSLVCPSFITGSGESEPDME